MPFGPYKDFAACVLANKDKSSPEAYCAAVHKRTTGKYPTEAGEDVIKTAETLEFEDTILRHVPIFTTGKLTDSMGRDNEFTSDDLAAIIDAFSQGVPSSIPVKIGHSTDEFNQKVADGLGIPKELVIGEGDKERGQVRLGEVTSLHRNGQLTADLRLNEKVGQLIKDKLLTGLSAEIQFDRKQGDKVYSHILSGLALLGAQRPALSDLPSLQQATMLEDGSYADAVFFQDGEGLFEGIHPTNQQLGFPSNIIGEGVATLPSSETSSGEPDEKTYTVPFRDLARGRYVSATVSAPNEITAKRVALRTVENFLLSATGPLGGILGGALGGLVAARLVIGKPVLGGIKGLFKWKFEEAYTSDDFHEAVAVYEQIGRLLVRGDTKMLDKDKKDEKFAAHPDGVDPEAWASCMAKAREDGVDDPEAHCRTKFEEEAKEVELDKDVVKALGLEEKATKEQILAKVVILTKEQSKFEEATSELAKEVAALKHNGRVSHYESEVAVLTHTNGKAKERAEKLATIESTAGLDTATELLSSWKLADEYAEKAGITTALLDGGSDDESSFDKEVAKYEEANPKESRAEAIKATIKAHKDLYQAREI